MKKKSENTEKSKTKPKAAKPSKGSKTKPKAATPSSLKGLEMEYSMLNGEISKRIDLRQQLISVSLTLTGVFIGVSLAKEGESVGTVAFVYPPLATMLALSWMQSDLRVSEIGIYIRENIEPYIPGLGWQKYLYEKWRAPQKNIFRSVVLSHCGIFLITQILAIGAGLLKFAKTPEPVGWAFLLVDALSIWGVIWVIRKTRKR